VSTTTCSECRSLLGGYVLHALEPDDATAVRAHLAACDACAIEFGQLAGLPAMLDAAGGVETPAEQPPPALEEAVLDRFAREHRGDHEQDRPPAERLRARLRRAFARPLPAALAGAVAAAAITAAILILPGGGDAEGARYTASLSGSAAAPDARATADLRVFSSGTEVRLKVRGLHGSPDNVYQLWCLREDGGKVSAGTFRTDADGRADVSLTTAAVPGEYHRLGIERRHMSPAGDRGTSVMAGEIHY
jgi:anti-sigma factor RsiW